MLSDEERKNVVTWIQQVSDLLKGIPKIPREGTGLSSKARNLLRVHVSDAIQKLRVLVELLDPVSQPTAVFDPSDPRQMGRLIALTLLDQPVQPLATLNPFYGSGVYAVYYSGEFDAYLAIKGTKVPIYVGKVDPSDSGAESPRQQGVPLWKRLKGDHAKNLARVKNLRLDDFGCRFLVVKSAWQSTAETYLIETFKPVWNKETKICYGFGKHGDKAATRGNKRSPWDTLHPARTWALDSPEGQRTAAEIIALIKAHYKNNPPENMIPK